MRDLEEHLQQRERGDSLSGEGVGSLLSQIEEIDEEPSVTLLKAADEDYDDDEEDSMEPPL